MAISTCLPAPVCHSAWPHLHVELYVLGLLGADHDWVDEVEVQNGDHLVVCRCKEGVAHIAEQDVQRLALATGVPAQQI